MAYRLLLADDSVTIQRVIELTFADEDIEVTAVGDGQQAIERIRADAPDIVLADVDMPERDGFEVAAFVKQTPELAHIPVVLLTGAFEPIDEARVAQAGCDGVLAKPFEPQLLIARVKELLTSAPGVRPPEQERPAAPARFEPTAAGSGPATVSQDPALSLDDYFEQLDVAFSNLGSFPPSKAEPAEDPASFGDDVRPAGINQERPFEAERLDAGFKPARDERRVPDNRPSAPPLATTFSALLAAEHGTPIPPGALPSVPASALPLDAIAEEVTRRVLASAAGQLLREQVGALVSEIAERLVREEIERLKASIK